MSLMLVLTGNTPELTSNYFPSIALDNGEWSLGLIAFETFNSVPNIDSRNQKFFCGGREYVVPTGTYELKELGDFLKKILAADGVSFNLDANLNTLKCNLRCSKDVDFTKPGTFRDLLGFEAVEYQANQDHISEHPVDILKLQSMRVQVDICKGSYINEERTTTIYEFFPAVPAGYKIMEAPKNAIYMPVNTRSISRITVKIVDQNNELVNFRGENITVRLHLKRWE